MRRQLIVHIDDREPATLIEALEGLPDLQVLRRRLTIGDYRWPERLVVERKTVPDLIASIFDQRFFKQIHRLRQVAETPCLLIEGVLPLAAMAHPHRQAVQGALIHAALVHGIPILRSRDPAESAWLMHRATRQLAGHGRIRRPALRGRRRYDKRHLQRHVLEGIPGLGPERADRLLDRFGNITAITQASEEELRQISGIGKETAQRLRWIVSERTQVYEATPLA